MIKSLPFIEDIVAADGKIYQVGGAVRDHFLGRESKDLDIVICGVSAKDLTKILETHGHVKPQMVGGTFAMIKFIQFGTTSEIDIALPRTERKVGAGYQGFEIFADHRLPIETDLFRRDFTINSMAMDLDGNLIDPFDGLKDLREGVIRVTNPEAFKDDPLRMLRAVQFAARFDFKIDIQTLWMIQENASKIVEISGERILMEFEKVVQKGKPEVAAEYLLETHLYKHIFGIHFAAAPPWYMSKVKRMSEFIYLLTYNNSDIKVDQFYAKRLKGDVPTTKEIKALVRAAEGTSDHIDASFRLYEINKLAPGILDTFVIREFLQYRQLITNMQEGGMPFSSKELAISGDDLIEMGIPEGPAHGKIFKKVLYNVFAGDVANKKEDLTQFINTLIPVL